MHLVTSQAREAQAQASQTGEAPLDKNNFQKSVTSPKLPCSGLHGPSADKKVEKDYLANTAAELISCKELFFVFT